MADASDTHSQPPWPEGRTPKSLEEFEQCLAASRVMTREDIAAFLNQLDADPQDHNDLAKELVRTGTLTRYQAQVIGEGKIQHLVLGNYLVLDHIGAGGMGVVYKAKHRRMDNLVALKMLPSDSTSSPEAAKRFQREVKAAARLTHPNIVKAIDAGEAGGVSFLVMAQVEGQDLSSWVKQHGPMPLAQAVQAIAQAAHGLDYAHQEGVIHRDIKPSNLMMDRLGKVKILDMGLARLETSQEISEGLTQSGEMMGTVDYMSPEQAESTHDVDERADIYSLGCTLHYLATGRPPYAGESAIDRLIAHVEDPIPSLIDSRPEVSPHLDEVFRTMMAKSPEDRYRSMTELLAALAATEEARGSGESSTFSLDSIFRTTLSRRFSPQLMVMSAILLVSLVALAISRGWFARTPASRRAPAVAQELPLDDAGKPALPPESIPVSGDWLDLGEIRGSWAVFSPDRKTVLAGQDRGTIAQVDIESREVLREIPGRLPVAFSADGKTMAAAGPGNRIQSWNTTTWQVSASHEADTLGLRKLQFASDGRLLAISPDGSRILTYGGGSVARLLDAKTGRAIHQFSDHKLIRRNVRHAAFSPDGNTVAFSVTGQNNGTFVQLFDVASGRPVGSTVGGWPQGGGARLQIEFMTSFSPDGRLLVAGTGGGDVRLLRVPTAEAVRSWPTSKPAPLAPTGVVGQVRMWPGAMNRPFFVSGDGRFVFWASAQGKHVLTEVASGRTWREFPAGAVDPWGITPDGHYLLEGRHAVALRDLQTGKRVWAAEQLMAPCALAADGELFVARDRRSQRFVVCRRESGARLLTLVETDSEPTERWAATAVDHIVFSADGTSVLVGYQTSDVFVWRLPADILQGPPDGDRALTSQGSWKGRRPALSPDGFRLAVADDQGKTVIVNLDKSPTGQRIGVAASAVAWLADGRLVLGGTNGKLRLWDVTSNIETASMLGHRGAVTRVAVTSGQQYLVSSGNDATIRIWQPPPVHSTDVKQNVGEVARIAFPVDVRARFLPDGRQAITLSHHQGKSALQLWDVDAGNKIAVFEGFAGQLKSMALSANGRILVADTTEGKVLVWSVLSQSLVHTLDGNGPFVVLQPQRQLVGGGGADRIRVWDLTDGKETRSFPDLGRENLSLHTALLDSGETVSMAKTPRRLLRWNTQTGEVIIKFPEGRESIGDCHAVASIPNEAKVLITPRGGLPRIDELHLKNLRLGLWDADTGRLIRGFYGHNRDVLSVAVFANRGVFVSGSGDATIRLWDLQTGKELYRIEGHTGAVTRVGTSPDAQYVLSASRDRTICKWRLPRPIANLVRGDPP